MTLQNSDFTPDYLSELAALGRSEAPARKRYGSLKVLFNSIIDEATAASPINFSGPFAKMSYLLQEYGADDELARAVNDARIRMRRPAIQRTAVLEAHIRGDIEAITEFLHLLAGDDNVHTARTRHVVSLPGGEESLNYLRVLVRSVGDGVVQCVADSLSLPELNLVLRPEDAYLQTILRPGDQLNLIRPRHAGPSTSAEYIIYEPDNLVNVSSIAACFTDSATDARLSIVNRLRPSTNTAAANLGNFASLLLDHQIHHGKPSYDDAVREFFKTNAFRLATCDLDATFHTDGRRQLVNINTALEQHLPGHVGEFDPHNVMVEPVFFSEVLGLQGRMDFLQLDFRVLLEQKAGKGEWPHGGFVVPRQKRTHFVQLLLYMALIRYNFPEIYAANRRYLSAFLLYSRYEQPLLAPGFAPDLLAEAVEIRNMSVWYRRRLAEGDDDFLCTLTADDFAPVGGGRLWEDYTRPQLDEILRPICEVDALTRAYWRRMLRFVATEHSLAAIGNKSKQASGFASLWHNSLSEKLEAGNIFANLTLVKPKADYEDTISALSLTFSDDGSHDMANFRLGDSVILYSYPADDEPDARRSMVFRCSIAAIGTDTIELGLRFAQSGMLPFRRPADHRWAIEHDFMDSSFNGLYQGVHAFLTMPARQRDLLLLQREPEIDRSKTLAYDHGDFNTLALRVKQASDIFLIIGPPGTGKTSYGLVTTLREQLAEEGSTVLMLSFTNRAVDEICERLELEGLDYLRVGPESSCPPEYRGRLLDGLASECPNVKAVRRLIQDARIVVGTTSALTSHLALFELKYFDLAIIDEASQILEPHLLGIFSARYGQKPAIGKIVMIGDHRQLPAVVQQTRDESAVSDPALQAIGLTDCRRSLFERMLERYGKNPDVTYMLTRQGRMHADIAAFPSKVFYGGLLTEVPLPHQTKPLPPGDDMFCRSRMIFIDVEADSGSSSDKVNRAEARVIADLIEQIAAREPDFGPMTVGVIVPYRNQITAVRHALRTRGFSAVDDVTIDTVERYQGGQRKYIIYGFTVRRRRQLRFLTEHTFTDTDGITVDRKLNVALTRAREYMICVGKRDLLEEVPLFRSLLEHIAGHGLIIEGNQSSQ